MAINHSIWSRNGHINKHVNTHSHTSHTECINTENGAHILYNWWQEPTSICILRKPQVNSVSLKQTMYKHTFTDAHKHACTFSHTEVLQQHDSGTYLTLWSSCLFLFAHQLASLTHIERERAVCLSLIDFSQLSTLLPPPILSLISEAHINTQKQPSLPPSFLSSPVRYLSRSCQNCLSPPIPSLCLVKQCERHSTSHTHLSPLLRVAINTAAAMNTPSSSLSIPYCCSIPRLHCSSPFSSLSLSQNDFSDDLVLFALTARSHDILSYTLMQGANSLHSCTHAFIKDAYPQAAAHAWAHKR